MRDAERDAPRTGQARSRLGRPRAATMRVGAALAAALFGLVAATAGSAATYNLGDLTGTVSATEILKVKTVDFLTFTLDTPTGYALSALDITVNTVAGSNFRPVIGLYAGNTLIATTASSAAGKAATLSFSVADSLTNGTYSLGIGGWIAKFPANIAQASSSAYFNNGTYTVRIDPTISPVPLPAGGLLLVTGLCALALSRRRARAS